MTCCFSKLTNLSFDQSTVTNSCVHLISLLSVQSIGKNKNNKHFNVTVPPSIQYGGMHQYNKGWVILYTSADRQKTQIALYY